MVMKHAQADIAVHYPTVGYWLASVVPPIDPFKYLGESMCQRFILRSVVACTHMCYECTGIL